MSTLLLRLDAPLMAFGGATLGKRRSTLPFPTSSALVGLFANALGYDRNEAAPLDALQADLTLLSREDRPLDRRRVPHPDLRVVDAQNVLVWKEGATATSRTAGVLGRHGGQRTITLDKEVVYLANVAFAVAVTSTGIPVERLAQALVAPARTLFLGRKACLPGTPLVEGVLDEPALEALRRRAPGRALYRGPADLPAWPEGAFRRVFPAPSDLILGARSDKRRAAQGEAQASASWRQDERRLAAVGEAERLRGANRGLGGHRNALQLGKRPRAPGLNLAAVAAARMSTEVKGSVSAPSSRRKAACAA